MKKVSTKLLSFILTALLVVSALPLSFVSAADTVMQDDLSKVENLAAIVSDPTKNIIHSWSNTTTKGEPMTACTTYTDSTNTDKVFQSDVNKFAVMTNGNINETHGDLSGGFTWFDSNKQLRDGYVDITFNLPGVAEITNFLLASVNGDSQIDRRIWEYQLFAANDLSTLYDEGNLLYHYNKNSENQATNGQYITFGEPVQAQYFGLRILNGCNPSSPEGSRGSAYPRIREMAIIGSVTVPEELKPATVIDVKEAIDELDTEYNLLNGLDYVPGDGTPGTIKAAAFNGTSAVSASIKSYNTEQNDLVDHDIDGPYHADISGVEFFKNGSFVDGVYLTLSFALMHEATIDKIFISHAINNISNLRTYEYEIYASDTLEDLYEGERCGYFLNGYAKQNQVFVFETPIVAKYVGVKILKAVQPNCTANSSTYARIAEVAVFGEYNIESFQYTVSSGEANLINDSGEVYYGKKLSYTVPLYQDGYTLRDWTLNGQHIDYTFDKHENTASVEIEITQNSDIVAVYTPDDEAFTSNDTYGVLGNKVRVPQHQVLHELRYGFDQMPGNISAKFGGEALEDKDFVKRGVQLILSSNGVQKQVLSVVIAGDINNSGKITASDITIARTKILGGNATDEQRFLFDSDNSGDLSVTDITFALDSILNAPATETDYTNVTTAMADLDYKTQGRYVKNDNGSLTFDWTASGFSFNADLYGDIYLNVTQGPVDARYYTAVVDGQEFTVQISGSSAQNVLIARDVPSGIHSIGFYKQGEGGSSITVNGINVNGKILKSDAESDLLIEFIGDSITCGAGNTLENGKEAGVTYTQNGYYAYGTVTARMLGADWSNISSSGSSLIDDRERTPSRAHMPTEYEYAKKGKTTTATDVERWGFERKADIVVVNLGTNDSGIIGNYAPAPGTEAERIAYFTQCAYDFAKKIIEINGEDVKIVFAFGMMTATPNFADAAYQAAIEKLATEDGYTNAYYTRLPTDNTGGHGHPTIAGDIAAAEVLSAFITNTVLAD